MTRLMAFTDGGVAGSMGEDIPGVAPLGANDGHGLGELRGGAARRGTRRVDRGDTELRARRRARYTGRDPADRPFRADLAHRGGRRNGVVADVVEFEHAGLVAHQHVGFAGITGEVAEACNRPLQADLAHAGC